jgi:hypothetical protein
MAAIDKEHNLRAKTGWLQSTKSTLVLIIIHDLRWYDTLQGDNYLKSVKRFDHMMFVCRFQASR